MSCPNKNMPDWSDLVARYGEETAYYIFIKNGDKVPYLQGRESNRFIWNIENELGLVNWTNDNGKNTKSLKNFTRDEAVNHIEDIENRYVGNFTTSLSQEGDSYGVKIIGHPVLKSEYEQYNYETNNSIKDYIEYKRFTWQEEGLDAFEDVFPQNLMDESYILYENNKSIGTEDNLNRGQLKNLITSKMLKVKEVVFDQNMDDLSSLDAGTLRVNPDMYTTFGKLLIDLRGGNANSFIQNGVELIRSSNIFDETADELDLLEKAIESEPEAIFEDEANRSEFEKWLLRYTKWLATRTGITRSNIRTTQNLPTGDITDEEWQGRVEDPLESTKTAADRIEENILKEYKRIRNKATAIVQERIDKALRTGYTEDVGDLRDLLVELENKDIRDTRGIIQFVQNVSNLINREYAIYLTEKKKEPTDPNTFDLKLLHRWNDLLKSYDILDDIVKLLPDESFMGVVNNFDKSTTNVIKRQLQDILVKKNTLRDQYITRGADKVVQALKPHSGRVKIQTKEQKRQEWQNNHKNEIGKGKKYSKEEATAAGDKYADDYIKANIGNIMEETSKMLRDEMDTASEGDVNLITLWLDTMLDTNDMVLAATVKKIVIQKGLIRMRAKSFQDEAWPLVNLMYEEAGYIWGTGDITDVYKDMLEVDSKGNRTGHLINKIHSSFYSEYAAVKARNAHLPNKEAAKRNFEWYNENNPLDTEARDKALKEYLDDLKNKGIIKQDDITIFYEQWFAKRPREREALWTLLDEDSTNGASLIERWMQTETRSFRNPIAKWESKTWEPWNDFMKANPNSPKVKFYKLIDSKNAEINEKLPSDKRKYGQLPFMYKDSLERYTAGQGGKDIGKDALQRLVERRIDEEGRGEYTDMNDKPLDYVPFLFTRPTDTFKHEVTYKLLINDDKRDIAASRNKEFKTYKRIIFAKTGEDAMAKAISRIDNIDESSIKLKEIEKVEWSDKDQSYNLLGIFSEYFRMADNHSHMTEILPEVEMVKKLIEHRDYAQKDSKGNTILKKLGLTSEREVTKKGVNANIVKMFEHFVKTTMYGQGKMEEGSVDVMGWKFDGAKFRDNLNKYASISMLSLNMLQGISNVGVGELTQMIEAHAGSYITKKLMHKATVEYGKELPSMLGDIGQPTPKSKVTHFNELFDTLNEYGDPDYMKNKRYAHLMSTSTLFFLSKAGEHFMQTRTMMAMLMKKQAYDKNGKELGSIYDNYSMVDGKFTLSKEVDRVKSGWTEEEVVLFGAKVKKLLAMMHGNYSELDKNAAQRHSIGRLAMLFRKFIVPGFKRRYGKRQINEFLEEYTEGSYRAMFGFLGKAFTETRALGLASFTENWKEMTPRDQANIMRGVTELGVGLMLSILASAFLSLKGDADDDKEKWALSMAAYVTSRVNSEMWFYIDPQSTMTIIKSPAVASAIIDDVLSLGNQLVTDPLGTYERGSWKDRSKSLKKAMKLLPVVKQYYKVQDVEDALIYFK